MGSLSIILNTPPKGYEPCVIDTCMLPSHCSALKQLLTCDALLTQADVGAEIRLLSSVDVLLCSELILGVNVFPTLEACECVGVLLDDSFD